MRWGRICGVGLLGVAALVGGAAASDGVAPKAGASPLEERLHVFAIGEHVWRGALPAAEDFKALADKGVKHAVSLLAENEVPAEVKQAAAAAGVSYRFAPIALNEGGLAEAVRIDRAAVTQIVDALKQADDGVTYVHCGTGRDRSGVIEFAYRVRVDGWDFAPAMRAAVERGFHATALPGFVHDMKLLASGFETLPEVAGMPITDQDLLSRGKLVAVGGARLNVKTMGAGPALYLLSGGPGESYLPFRPYLDALSDAYTVVYFDPRGCGNSSKPQFMEAYSIDRLAGDVEKLREALGHERISLLAHSSGGAVAVRYALAHPERVDRLIIVSSWAAGEEIMAYAPVREALMSAEEDAALRRLRNKLTAEARFFNDAELTAATRLTMAHDFFGVMTPEFRADWARHIHVGALAYGALREEYFGGKDGSTGVDLRPELKKLTGIPTLAIAGRFDLVTPPDVVRPFADLIPEARFEVAERSGHYPFVEENAWFLRQVREFLASGK